MHVSVSDAKAQLTDLVRRAEAGDEVILTRRGTPAVRLVPVSSESLQAQRRRALDKAVADGLSRTPDGGPDAARSQDWLYDDRGVPA